jgi:Protein of unknown function (DUF4038)
MWSYRTQAVPAVNGLDGKRGTFESRHGAVNNRFGRHGAVRISASKRFFEHADGTPFFWMGDTVWYGAILSSRSDRNAYLSDRASYLAARSCTRDNSPDRNALALGKFRDEQWLDFVTYQSGHGDDTNTLRWIYSGPPSRRWQDAPFRPFINLESPYEGHLGYQSRKPHSDYSTRRAIYWSLMNAPTAGVTYGPRGFGAGTLLSESRRPIKHGYCENLA